jgi:hypothetical protein
MLDIIRTGAFFFACGWKPSDSEPETSLRSNASASDELIMGSSRCRFLVLRVGLRSVAVVVKARAESKKHAVVDRDASNARDRELDDATRDSP